MSKSKIKVKMIGSPAGGSRRQKETLKGLGLTRMHQIREIIDTPCSRGMVNKIPHLVEIVAGK